MASLGWFSYFFSLLDFKWLMFCSIGIGFVCNWLDSCLERKILAAATEIMPCIKTKTKTQQSLFHICTWYTCTCSCKWSIRLSRGWTLAEKSSAVVVLSRSASSNALLSILCLQANCMLCIITQSAYVGCFLCSWLCICCYITLLFLSSIHLKKYNLISIENNILHHHTWSQNYTCFCE